MMDDLEVMRAVPQADRMEDLPPHPRIFAEQERQKRREALAGQLVDRANVPQPTAIQRRRNQQTQPRDRAGKYAEKPGSKWKQHLPGGSGPVAPTSLKRQRTPARPTSRRSTANVVPHGKRTQTPLPSMAAMEHAHPLAKVHWWVTRGFRRWRRRKMTALKALFSLKG